MNRRPAFVLALASLLLPACATGRGGSLDRLPVAEFRGHFASAPGASWFTPCGAAPDDRWWVTLTGTAVGQAEAARKAGALAPGAPAFVRWRAAKTTGGEVGPRGPGQPALLVREVLEIRAAADGDCAVVPR